MDDWPDVLPPWPEADNAIPAALYTDPALYAAEMDRVFRGPVDAEQLCPRAAHAKHENAALHLDFEVLVGDPAAQLRDPRRPVRPQAVDRRSSPFHQPRIVSA